MNGSLSVVRDRLPDACIVGQECGFDHLRHGETLVEAGPCRNACGDGLKEVARLDDDLVLVAGAMARALAEGKVIRMRGPRQDTREAARLLRPLGAVEMDGVLILLIEADRALGAVDLVGIAHLAACGGAAE